MFTSESLKERRESLKLSRRSLAAMAGYTDDYIYMLETRRRPMTVEASRKIESALASHYENTKRIIEGEET